MKLCHMESRGRLWSWLLIALLSCKRVAPYDPGPRWGQAAVVVNDAVFIHGGKTDLSNSYSYTSAPTTNDVLYLSLSSPFNVTNPPWELVVSSAVASVSQDPLVSWHTLSAYNTSGILLFGGMPGYNSPIVIVGRADSAAILDISNQSQPIWQSQPLGWAGQPARRVHHSAASSPSGTIYIIGGIKADGSGEVFPEHYEFDPQASLFSQLPSDNSPPDIYGHVSIMLPDGRLFIFGGITQGSLNPFSAVWVLDTTKSPPYWSMLQVDTSSLPSPRRAFAAVNIGNDKILIHGGSDANLQGNLDDGWILDASREPAVWTSVDQLTQLGARRDHLAVFCNGQAIVGFGYSNSGPAPASLQIFDLSTNSYLSSFTPSSPNPTTQTMPGQTKTQTGTPTSGPGSPTGTKTTGGTHPTPTAGGNIDDDNAKKTPAVAIAVGTTLGVLGAVGVCAGFIIYTRYQRRKREGEGSFLLMGDDGDGGNSSLHAGSVIPAATMHDEKTSSGHHKWGGGLLGVAFEIAGTLGAATKSRNARSIRQRRDMLADEDTRQFGEWYNSRRREGISGSSWSLKSIIGGHLRSREPSVFSLGSGANHRYERPYPYSEETSLFHNDDLGTPGTEGTSRPPNRREISNLSSRSGYSYVDPFADPIQEEKRHGTAQADNQYHDDGGDHQYEPTFAVITAASRPQHSLSSIRTVLPVSMGGHPLSPLSEHTSKTSLAPNDPNTSTSSHALSSENPFDASTSRVTSSYTSIEPSTSRSPKLLSPSIATSSQAGNIHHSHSWWSRFYNTSFLDRNPSSASRRSAIPDIRDPNPPPALGPIQESLQTTSPEDSPPKSTDPKRVPGQLSKENSEVYGTNHGKSMSSLRTADTERIERMAGMDVVQRVRTSSHRASGSISSGLSIDTHQTGPDEPITFSSPVEMSLGETPPGAPVPISSPPMPPVARQNSPGERSQVRPSTSSNPVAVQPMPQVPLSPIALYNKPSSPGTSTAFTSLHGAPANPAFGLSVADRVQMYQRRMSQDQEQLPPTNTRQREERSAQKDRVAINYGLVPRQSLFVANPDYRSSSGDS